MSIAWGILAVRAGASPPTGTPHAGTGSLANLSPTPGGTPREDDRRVGASPAEIDSFTPPRLPAWRMGPHQHLSQR